MVTRKTSFKLQALSLLFGGLIALSTLQAGCTDDQDLCHVFCDKAASCLGCGGTTADIDQCRQQCVSLSIDEKKSLSDCAQDCYNIRACPALAAHPKLNPCKP